MNASRDFVSKFAVFENGKVASSVWRAWKGKNNDNVYIAPRNIAGTLKISLHENRHCHLAFTSQHWKKEGSPGTPRTMLSWHRPETPSGRITILASLLIAEEFLAPWIAAHDQIVHHLPPPGLGLAYKITFIFSRIPTDDLVLNKETGRSSANLGSRPVKSSS